MPLWTRLLRHLGLSSAPACSHVTTSNLNQNERTFLSRFSKRQASGVEMAKLDHLKFDNLALKTLPLDKQEGNFVRQVSGACFSLVDPSPVENPQLVVHSKSALELLGLAESVLSQPDFVDCLAGNKKFAGSVTAAHCYCGHQFGNFAGQLGDGAAIYLGEIINARGERWELQLKGAGKTPYSRSADGRKVLRSSVREFLCSEAMHGLGIPTTRAATCVTSDSKVIRDIFYNGNAILEKCTIVSRIAPSFIRFGSFEIFKPTDEMTGRQGPSVGRTDILTQLLDYVVATFYAEIWEAHPGDKVNAYVAFYEEIVRRTARLVAQWMCVGWCHGVLNTDNMSIVGVTIDYGPFGFLDAYDPAFICNNSDDGGRYAYDQQPSMCRWNLGKLAEALSPLVPLERLNASLDALYDTEYQRTYDSIMAKKFGILNKMESGEEQVRAVRESLLQTMRQTGADFTNTFRALSSVPLPAHPQSAAKQAEFVDYVLTQCATVEDLKKANRPKMDARQLNMLMQLMQVQPELLAQLRGGHKALTHELERRERAEKLEDMTSESKTQEDRKLWEDWLTKYCDLLKKQEDSVASDDLDAFAKNRVKVMNETNPRFILRNYMAQAAIDAAEKGDYSEVRRVLALLQNPFDEGTDVDLPGGSDTVASGSDVSAPSSEVTSETVTSCHVARVAYDAKPPQWAADLRVT